jgi:hypothetical protein
MNHGHRGEYSPICAECSYEQLYHQRPFDVVDYIRGTQYQGNKFIRGTNQYRNSNEQEPCFHGKTPNSN